MKKRFKIFKIVSGYRGQDLPYYCSTPFQIDDVTYEVTNKGDFETEKQAASALEKTEELKHQSGNYLILPVYLK